MHMSFLYTSIIVCQWCVLWNSLLLRIRMVWICSEKNQWQAADHWSCQTDRSQIEQTNQGISDRPVNSVARIKQPDKFGTSSTPNVPHLQILQQATIMRNTLLVYVNKCYCYQMESSDTLLNLLSSVTIPTHRLVALLWLLHLHW